ncbi:MAG: carbohydrate ABC transporter permease, partial [Caldilineaceae bacterium]|nr:carbohydrate ABC transporter permease [Caldilineaceae bacterium]
MAGERRLGRIIAYVILVGWTFVVGIPTYWLFITAFKRPEAINRGATYFPWIDFQPSLLAFYDVFVIQGLANSRPFVNSVVVALATATISTVIGGAGGYALARFPFRAGPLNNDRIAFGFLIQRMFPPAVLLIPFLILFRTLRLLDTREGLVLVYCAFSIPFVVWMMRDFFRSLPVEIEESALIDGCNRLGVLFRIAIPLSAPGFVTAFVLVMIGSWNEFLFALTFMFNKAVTLPLYLTLQTSIQAGTEYW